MCRLTGPSICLLIGCQRWRCGWGRGKGDEKLWADIAKKRQQRNCDGTGKNGKINERGTLNQGREGGGGVGAKSLREKRRKGWSHVP